MKIQKLYQMRKWKKKLNIYEIKNENQILRLVKLRNPWGEKEFNGDWSDKSSKWTDELKKKVDFEGVKDDGKTKFKIGGDKSKTKGKKKCC